VYYPDSWPPQYAHLIRLRGRLHQFLLVPLVIDFPCKCVALRCSMWHSCSNLCVKFLHAKTLIERLFYRYGVRTIKASHGRYTKRAIERACSYTAKMHHLKSHEGNNIHRIEIACGPVATIRHSSKHLRIATKPIRRKNSAPIPCCLAAGSTRKL